MIRKGWNITSVMIYYGSSSWTCTTFSLLYLEQQGYRSNYPNSSRLVSAHSRDGSVITSLLGSGTRSQPTEHTLNNVFFQYHTPLYVLLLYWVMAFSIATTKSTIHGITREVAKLLTEKRKFWQREEKDAPSDGARAAQAFMFVWHFTQHATVLWTCSWCV